MGYASNTFRKIQYPSGDDADYRVSKDKDGLRKRPVKKTKKETGRGACGKARYDDEFEAGKKLKAAQRWARRNGFKMPVRYYYHKKCRGYHITSQETKGQEAA